MSEHETIVDIIAEMRGMGNYQRYSGDHARVLAGRLEAALKLEMSKAASKNGADFGQLGDCSKLREALIDVVKRIEAYVGCDHHTFHPTATTCDGITSVGKCCKIGTCAAIFKARAALAAPPRNCDVGTAEEQDNRFAYQFCRVGIEGCIRCKLDTLKHRGNTCGIHWAQMPYEGGAK